MILEHLTEPGGEIKNVLIFHHPCQDGFMSAVIARYHFGPGCCLFDGRNYDKPYDPSLLGICAGKAVYILDFSMPLENLRELAAVANSVLVLDHHKSFAERLGVPEGVIKYDFQEKNLTIQFDVEKCGAELAWDFFVGEKVPKPQLLSYVADRDLWTWKLPGSREVSAMLHTESRTYERWSYLMARLDLTTALGEYIQGGGAILKAQNVEVDKLATRAFFIPKSLFSPIPVEVTDPNWVGTIPISNTPSMQSEVCERMLQLYPETLFSAAFFHKDLHTRIWSLRSRKGSMVDVSAICKAKGGGGHFNAAGYTEAV